MFQTRVLMIYTVGLVLELLSVIVQLMHIQPSCWLWTTVDFCFVGSPAKNLC